MCAADRKRLSPLLLNAVPFEFDRRSLLHVGKVPYAGEEALGKLRQELRTTHVMRRAGQVVEVVATGPRSETPGEVSHMEAGDATRLVTGLLTEWLTAHFVGLGRQVQRRRRSIVVVSGKPEDDLLAVVLPRGFPAPAGIGLRTAFELVVRTVRGQGGTQVLLLLDATAMVFMDVPVQDLVAGGVPVEGLWVCRPSVGDDCRLIQPRRLAGRVAGVKGEELLLREHDEGGSSISARDSTLEPRLEVLATVLAALQRRPSSAQDLLGRLRGAAEKVGMGRERLTRLDAITGYLRRQKVELADGLHGHFAELARVPLRFSKNEVVRKPPLVFDSSGRRTDSWNQRGLDEHGPYDRYQFNPKRLNIAVVCRADLQGRMEQFVEQLLNGVRGVRGGDVGFLRRFALERPYVQVFTAPNATAASYRAAAVAAIEHITDKGQTWQLALVQIEKAMEDLEGDVNPYLVTKAFFLGKGIAVQHVHFETVNQQQEQRAWSLNNMGLACYAKLGGVPWLLPSDQTVSHELVIGLGSYHERGSRFGAGDRYVGVTTVFSGDGRYLVESRTRAVPYREYSTAMLEAVRAAVGHVRQDFAWAPSDPVRLVFHVFKPLKNAEAEAVEALMEELALPHAEFAFLHIADSHSFLVFDESEQGAAAGGGRKKGALAPPRGLLVQLSGHEALLCLKGARELKQAGDGHPSPLLLDLHKGSTFNDITYLSRQVFAFSCNSWRSFQPSPMPITIQYSQLVAENLGKLRNVTGWSDDSIVGRVGRTRWFL